MLDAYIFDGLRTPIGRHAGKLAPVRPDDLAAEVVKQVVARNKLEPTEISDVVWAASTRPARTAGMSRALPRYFPACRRQRPASPSTACARAACRRWSTLRAR
jgi:acetyl-CoA acetyltransferase